MKTHVANRAVFASLAMLVSGLLLLPAAVMAEVVERYNAAGDLTGSGTDVGAVQTASGAASGDVLKLSGTATQNTSYGNPVTQFTIQSVTPGTKQTINAGNTRLYNFNDGAKTYDITLKDLDYQGYADPVGNAIGLYMHTSPACTLDIKTDNVSFTGFKNAGYHGGVFGIDGSGNLKITATNGLVFDGNRSNASTGGAIHVNAGTFTITADTLTFRNNFATTYGGAIKAASGTITAGTLLFDGNSTSNNDAGAIYATGSFTINGSNSDAVTTVNANYTKYKGGAIRCDGTLTLNTGTFNFTNNYNTTASDKYSYGGAVHTATIDTDAKTINFDSNKSTYYGGGLSVNGGTLKADTIIFNKNTSDNRGGGIFTNGSLTITGNTIKFTDNFANNFGGAIFNNAGDSTLTINGKDVLFSGNHISANDSGTIHGGNVTLNGVDANSVFTFDKNYTKYYGSAINSNAVTLNTGTFNFTGNYETASSSNYSYGGAISCTSMTTNAKTLNFDGNTSRYYGGAIALKGTGDGTIALQADTITFNANKADVYGGAIYGKSITVRGANVSFTGNQAKSGTTNSCGGVIYSPSGTVTFGQEGDYDANYGVYTFSDNSCYYEGGAIFATGITTLNGKSFTFSNNTSETWTGGAIRVWKSDEYLALNMNAETTFTGNTSYKTGGALFVKGIVTANQFATFEDNTCQTQAGGAAYIHQSAIFNKGASFSGNTAGAEGGAVYAGENITFAGANSVGTFTNNTAANGIGNDLYLAGASSTLTFQDAGTYSFDGGIALANANARTVINQAQVTLAGRADVTTNNYQLQNVTISNGGKLTVDLDNINSATGTFALSDTSSILEFKTASEVAKRFDNTITGSGTLLKTGDGTLALDGTDAHPITADSLTVQGGSLLFKGFYTGDLTIKDGTLFSPGNSVGTLEMAGDFLAESGSTLLFEQDTTGMDKLIIRSGGTLEIANDATLDMAMTRPIPGRKYELVTAEDGLTGDYASSEFWTSLLSPDQAYYWNLNVEGNVLYASIDGNAIPEPSTWALLLLGVFGVMYSRKRK
ncbi:MAG: PEP-CTERM sorting domain-containing protein [Thermoguttaceae bacterium]|nr:PEP-CTERM sorting domain-containing protein [Thermoguttaceae bacterium]